MSRSDNLERAAGLPPLVVLSPPCAAALGAVLKDRPGETEALVDLRRLEAAAERAHGRR